jgi:uncharacterized protein (TIGR02246 family)
MQLMTKATSFFGFAKAAGTPEDVAAINAVVAEMTEGFNKHDAVAVSRVYTLDAEFTNVLGMTVKGAAEIEKFLASAFRTRLKAATLKTMDVTVRFIRRDVAVVHVTSQISGFLNPNGATEPPHSEFSIRVFQRENGIWLVGAFHNTTVAATLNRD